jgi:hypothetical protein
MASLFRIRLDTIQTYAVSGCCGEEGTTWHSPCSTSPQNTFEIRPHPSMKTAHGNQETKATSPRTIIPPVLTHASILTSLQTVDGIASLTGALSLVPNSRTFPESKVNSDTVRPEFPHIPHKTGVQSPFSRLVRPRDCFQYLASMLEEPVT